MKQRSADAAHIGQVVLEVRVELGIPKLLVKINPSEASRVSAKNLGEVLLRKLSAQKGHVAVLHMSRSVPPGELVMSLKLAEMLDVEEEESVELSLAGNAPREADKPACRPAPHAPTAPPLRPATSVPREPREAPKPSCTNGAYLDSGFTKAPAEHRPWGSFSGIAAPRVASDGSTARPGAGAPTAPPLRPATSIPRDREAPKSPCTNSTYLDSGFNKAPSEYRPWPSFSGTPATRAASDGCTGRPGAAPPAPPPPPPPPLRPATNVPRESREAPKSPWANSTYVDSGFNKAPSEHRPWASYSGTSPPRAAPDGSSTRWQMAEELIEEDGVKAGDAAGGKPWNAPSSQKRVVNNGRPVHSHPVPTVAEALEPSPLPSRAASQASSRASSVSSSDGSLELGQRSRKDFTTNIPVVRNGLKKGKEGCSKPSSQASSNVASSTTVSSPRISAEQEMRAADVGGVDAEQQTAAAPPQATAQGGAATMVPTGSLTWENAKANFSRRQSGLLNRRRTLSFGALQAETPKLPPSEPRQPVPSYWRGPTDAGGSGLERSELGSEVTAEIRRWLLAETSGPQCSQVVLDRALTVLANFKLASGCQLEVLGGPLGAIVGGYSDADWLHDEVFQKQPAEALRDAFAHFGFRPRHDGDWSNVAAEEVSLAYRRLCLRGHPSRGGAPRIYLKLQVAMELIRAFAGEAGSLDPHGRTPTSLRSVTTPCSRQLSEPSRDDFVLTDATLVRELKLTAHEAEEEAAEVSMEQLEEMNRALDEYILRQMCFKSEIVDEIARLHENCAYAILGVSADATDAEIKKAYRFIAMQCHPDKGGDKEDFQELHNAYEKIMEQRRSLNEATRGKSGSEGKYGDMDADNADLISEERSHEDHQEKSKSKPKAKSSKEPKDAEGMDGEQEEDEAEASEEDEYGEDSSNAALVEKATKAAEEASRYAKTAAEFAHQAAEAAETARRGREQGSRDTLTKSIAHSAIVLTLTVVKAVRVVGYATLDVAAQCRIVAKRYPAAAACSERAVSAMSLGLEALGAALSCAEVTETTAAELQAPTSNLSEEESSVWPAAAAERFVGAAVRASLAAANASNAAMSAAIAAVEGSRDVEKAVEEQTSANENQEAKRRPSHHGEGGQEGVDHADEDGDDDLPDIELPRQPPSAEEVAAASMRRLVAQRNNNHKVLQRLNSEILSHQENVRSFLQHNRALIPSVSEEEKTKVFRLLADYAAEARTELESILLVRMTSDEVLEVLSTLSLLVPFAQPQALAIPVSVKARVLKMAALYDISLTMKILDTEIFQVVQHANVMEGARRRIDEVYRRVKNELLCNVAETS